MHDHGVGRFTEMHALKKEGGRRRHSKPRLGLKVKKKKKMEGKKKKKCSPSQRSELQAEQPLLGHVLPPSTLLF